MRVGTALVKSPGEVHTKPKRHGRICSCVRPQPSLSPSEVISHGWPCVEQSPRVLCLQQLGIASAEPGLVPKRSRWWLLQGGASPLLPRSKGLALCRRGRGKKPPPCSQVLCCCPRRGNTGGRGGDVPAARLFRPPPRRHGKPGMCLLKRPAGGIWVMLGKRQLLCFPPPRAPQTAWCPALDSNRGTGGGQQDGSGRARTRGASSTRSKGPQLVTSARKPLMPRPGAGRFTPGTHFPFPSQKSCVNLTFKKLCLIPFYSFSSLANCSAFFVIFLCFFGFVLTLSYALCSVKSAHFGFITCSPGGWGRRRVPWLCVCAAAFGSSGGTARSR